MTVALTETLRDEMVRRWREELPPVLIALTPPDLTQLRFEHKPDQPYLRDDAEKPEFMGIHIDVNYHFVDTPMVLDEHQAEAFRRAMDEAKRQLEARIFRWPA